MQHPLMKPRNHPKPDSRPKFFGPLEWTSLAAIVAGFFAADFLEFSTLGKIVTVFAFLLAATVVVLLVHTRRRR
jgi:hypothetical protein